MTIRILTALLAALVLLTGSSWAGPTPHPFGSQVPMHGRLAPLDKAVPTPDGLFEFRYSVHDAATGGTQLASASTPSVDVINGIFFDAPNFGTEVFSGAGPRFVEVGIRPAGSGEAFQRFQRVEVKSQPRAQFAGEIFLPIDDTVSTTSTTSAIKVTNTGNGSVAQLISNGSDPTRSALDVTTTNQAPVATLTTTNPTNQSPGLVINYAGRNNALRINSTGIGSALNVNGISTLNGSLSVSNPGLQALTITGNNTYTGLTTITSNTPISTALGTVIISNTNATGRGLLAFNQMGGEGMFGSSIGGAGCVGDGTGPTSIALLGTTNNGRAGVFQNTLVSSNNPTVQINNTGVGAGLLINQSNPSATGTSGISISGPSSNTGITNNMETRLVNNVALGGNFNPSQPLEHTSGAFLSFSGVFTSVSSREKKEDFQPVDPRDVLGKVLQLPVTTWKYRVDSDQVRHLGPTAEDFAATFELGESDKAIGAVDADGVALAAIQGLHQLVQEKDAQIAQLAARLARLESLLETPDERHGR